MASWPSRRPPDPCQPEGRAGGLLAVAFSPAGAMRPMHAYAMLMDRTYPADTPARISHVTRFILTNACNHLRAPAVDLGSLLWRQTWMVGIDRHEVQAVPRLRSIGDVGQHRVDYLPSIVETVANPSVETDRRSRISDTGTAFSRRYSAMQRDTVQISWPALVRSSRAFSTMPYASKPSSWAP